MRVFLAAPVVEAEAWWAVVVPGEKGDCPTVVALFRFGDQAAEWIKANYRDRGKVVEAVIQ